MSKSLLAWWAANRREFPWRRTRDPYKILVSEVLLHRTKAEQVVAVYNEFLVEFPSIEALFQASLDDVRKVVYPLGLHWRTRLLKDMAVWITEKHGGKIPSTRRELELLPGVSHYIASAVMCFAFGLPEPMLDTNIVRILGRVSGTKVTDGSRRSKRFQELSELILQKENSRELNWALIDLGALVCKPRKPNCGECPLISRCIERSKLYFCNV